MKAETPEKPDGRRAGRVPVACGIALILVFLAGVAGSYLAGRFDPSMGYVVPLAVLLVWILLVGGFCVWCGMRRVPWIVPTGVVFGFLLVLCGAGPFAMNRVAFMHGLKTRFLARADVEAMLQACQERNLVHLPDEEREKIAAQWRAASGGTFGAGGPVMTMHAVEAPGGEYYVSGQWEVGRSGRQGVIVTNVDDGKLRKAASRDVVKVREGVWVFYETMTR